MLTQKQKLNQFCFLYSLCLHYSLNNIHIFHDLDSWLSGLFHQVSTSPDNGGLTVLPECLLKNDDLLTMKHFIHLCVYTYNQMCVQWSPLENGKVTVTPLYIIQDDHYIQVNFAENIRQLNILRLSGSRIIQGAWLYTIYRAVIYRFDSVC